MKLTTAIKKMEQAGATMTTVELFSGMKRQVATFPNGKTITFEPDYETNEVTTFARPYWYDDADQCEKCFFYDIAKKAIERVLAN